MRFWSIFASLLFPVLLLSQEPPREPSPETPAPKEEKAPKPKPAAPALPKITGLSDEFPVGEEKYLPDYKAEMIAPVPEKQEEKTQTPKPEGKSFLSLFQGDRTFLNILILCVFVGIFVLYRLRGRR